MQSTLPTPNTHKEDSQTFSAVSSRNSQYFKGLTHEDVWYEYKTHPSPKVRQRALEELLYRQNGMLADIARYVHRAHSGIAKFEDFMEYARLDAIAAYDGYDPERNNKLNTYVYTCVRKRLFTIVDEIIFIKRKSGQRNYRAYFNGKMDDDPIRKKQFEDRYSSTLDDKVKRQRKKTQVNTLNAEIISYDNYITTDEGNLVEKEFDNIFQSPPSRPIVEKVDWDNVVAKLTDIQKQIYYLIFECQYSMREVISKTGINKNDIKKEIEFIKLHFQAAFPELAV